MASIHHQIFIAADPDAIWSAARDVGRLHDRLVPGFVTATEMLPGEGAPVRRVTFVNGRVVDETIVSIDDDARRVVWAIKEFEHHNGALTVAAAPGGRRSPGSPISCPMHWPIRSRPPWRMDWR